MLIKLPKTLNTTNDSNCSMKEKVMTLRLPIEIDLEVGKLSIIRDIDKSKMIRELLLKGLKEAKVDHALKLYTEGKISLWKAARLADCSLWQMIEHTKEKKITAQYTEKELHEDLEALRA